MAAPLVTAVIPTRNRVAMLAQALAGVLGQHDVPFEVVVVDEGSTDGTAAFLARVAAADGRVRVVHHAEPRGLPAARNAGVQVAEGRWVAFCDDDDLWAPGKLAAQLDVAERVGAGWVATSAVVVDEALTPVGVNRLDVSGDVSARLRHSNIFPAGASSMVVDRDLIRSVGGFDESLRSSEDWELWLRLAPRSAVGVVDRPLTAYRLTTRSMSRSVDRMRESRRLVLEAHGGEPTPEDDYDYERYLTRQLVRAGDRWPAGRAYARLAVRHRRPAQLVRAVMAVAVPRRLDAVGTARTRREIPAPWWEELGWLASLAEVTPDALLAEPDEAARR
jgi:glycosyltransferase involved in cell wall biosynthesis